MEAINKKIRKSAGGKYSLKGANQFREDINTMAEYCNMLADKINELNEEVDSLKKLNNDLTR